MLQTGNKHSPLSILGKGRYGGGVKDKNTNVKCIKDSVCKEIYKWGGKGYYCYL